MLTLGPPFRITTSSPIYKVVSSMFCWEFPGDVSWDPKKKFCFLCSDGSCSPHQNTADGLPAVSKFPLYVLPGTALQTLPASPTPTKWQCCPTALKIPKRRVVSVGSAREITKYCILLHLAKPLFFSETQPAWQEPRTSVRWHPLHCSHKYHFSLNITGNLVHWFSETCPNMSESPSEHNL